MVYEIQAEIDMWPRVRQHLGVCERVPQHAMISQRNRLTVQSVGLDPKILAVHTLPTPIPYFRSLTFHSLMYGYMYFKSPKLVSENTQEHAKQELQAHYIEFHIKVAVHELT